MTIRLELSAEGIRSAVNRIVSARENLKYGVEQTLELLAQEGADVANRAYDGMAYATEFKDSETQTSINVPGGDTAIIAEFGAGYATMEYHPFAENAPVPIRVGSYSEENGGMFYELDQRYPGGGYWEFGGQRYTRVQPRHGLLDAHDYIMENGVRLAQGVIRL